MKNIFTKINICVYSVIVLAVALLFVVIETKDVCAYSYNTNVLNNPGPTSNSGWSLFSCQYLDNEFKATTNDNPFRVVQRFTFTDRDAYRINNGEIQIDASGSVWAQPGTYPESHVKAYCYNVAGGSTGSNAKTNTASGTQVLSFAGYTVPAGTKYIDFEVSNYSKKWTFPSAWGFSLVVKDTTNPTYIATTPVTLPAKYKVGTKIRYQVQFTEPVNVDSQGYMKYKVGTQDFTNGTYAGQSSDGTTLYYDITLPNTATLGDSLAVTITGLSGIAVKDDAGQSCTTIPSTLNLSNGFYVDNRPPEVASFTSSASTNAVYKAGETLQFDVTFHENIWVDGLPKVNLSNGKSATYISTTTSDTKIALFNYTIAADDDVKNIAISSIDFSGIKDSVSNSATLAATYSTSAYNSFMNNKFVSIDTQAPTTTFTAAPSGWQKAYDVILSPKDNISGVKEIYAAWTSIGGIPIYPVAANVDTTTNQVILPVKSGAYELHVKLVDKAGNTGTQKSTYTYQFDFDAPTISANATKIPGTNLVSSVTASASDSYSGLDTFTYSWINEDGITYLIGNASEGVSIPAIDGVFTLNLFATDKIGNTSMEKIENLAVDKTAPVITFDQMAGATYKQMYTVNLTVADEKSGVDGYYYIFSTSPEKPAADSDEWILTSATSIQTPTGVSGTYYLHIKAVDKVGNISITSTNGFNIDDVLPIISVNQNGNEGSVGRASYDVVITINDGITPYAELTKKYAVSESETCPEELSDLEDNQITIEKLDKTKYLYIVAIDAVGNKAVFKSNPFIADTTAPNGQISKEKNVYYTNSNAVTVNIIATDDYSSDIYMQVVIDGSEGEWEDIAEQKTVNFPKTEGEHTICVNFKDACDNISQSSVSYYYDITPPQIVFEYSTATLTNKAVTVVAKAIDSATVASFETVSEKTFDENGSFEFIAIDEAGNRAIVPATVDYIDKTKPTVTFESTAFDGKKHKAATVKIDASDANGISELKYAVVKSENTPDSYAICSNGQTIDISGLDGTFMVYVIAVDNAENSVEVGSQSIYLDNTPPVATIKYSPDSRTAQNVVATISFDETATITNNESSNIFKFTENNSFTFEFADEAGNTGSQTATVTWIDRSAPMVSVILKDEKGDILDSEKWTNTDVVAEVIIPGGCTIDVLQFNDVPAEDSSYITNLGNNKYKISEFGRLHYQVKDSVTGVITSAEIIIRIDKNAPSITNITYSTTAWTNGNVTATITASDDYNEVVYVNGSSHLFTQNGEFEFIIQDSLGNQTTKTATVGNIDKAVPTAQISYDKSELTNGDVTASISFDEGGSPISITNNKGLSSYKFNANGEFIFEFSDEAGNTGSVKAAVNNIDKAAPEISLESDNFDLKPHKNVSIKITASDANGIDEIKYRFIKGGENASYLVCENGGTVTLDGVNGTYTLEILATDIAGNTKMTISDSLLLDNTAPIGSIFYAPSARTAQNVIATIMFNEETTITNNSGLNEYIFTDNGEFTFEFEDKAGNTATTVAKVDWIDRNQPRADVVLSNGNWTREDVTVTLIPQAGAVIQNVKFNNAEIEENAKNQYLIKEYGTLSYEVLDLTTQTVGTGEVLIKIDRDAPSVSNIEYSTKNWTNKDVMVTVTGTDTLSSVTYVNGNSYSFLESGSHDFIIKDSAGNQTTKTVTVDWIDKLIPVAQISYDIDQSKLTNENVIVTITFDEGGSPVTITNNNGQSTYEFIANGEFTFEFADKAGNTGTATATVSNIEKVLPEVTFDSSYFDMNTYKSVDVTISATDSSGIASLKYKVVKVGEDNGEFVTCISGDKVTISGVSGVYQIIAIATDNVGNEKTVYSQSLYLDNSAPVATISYIPSARTAQNVIAAITFDEPTTITNNSGSTKYTFTDNHEFTFEFQDVLGNSGTATAKVNWIDRELPTSKVIVSNSNGDVIGDIWTNKDVMVSIIPSANSTIEDVRFNDGLVGNSQLIAALGNNQYIVSGYGKLTYTVKDRDTYLTNTGEVLIKVDKTLPIVKSIVYSSKTWTNQDVSVTIVGEDDLGTVSYPNTSSHVFAENGSYQFIIEDNAGNRITQTITVDWIDKSAPAAKVTYYVDGTLYDITKPTNKNVVAKLTFIEGGSPVSIKNNSGKAEYEFNGNGSFTFMLADGAGNEANIVATVSNIDKVAPTAYITYSYTGWTNKDVKATLVAADDVNQVIITNNPTTDYTFSQNGSFSFEFMDSAGNTGTATATVSKIDKMPPKLSYKLSTEEVTPFSVYAFIEADETVTIVNNSGKTSRQFTSNGDFRFEARDRAGNTSELTVVVTNISKETTPVKLTYSKTVTTNEDVFVTIEPKDGNSLIYVTNNDGQKTRKFTENGEFIFIYKNAAGIMGEAVASVTNIDKTLPKVSAQYSHTEITKEDVVCTLTADKEVTYPYLVIDGKYTFNKNMKLQLPVKDKVGNIANTIIETNLIDKTAPEITISNQYEVLAVGTKFDANAGVTATDDLGLDGNIVISGNYDVNAVGDYVITYTISDKAGNASTKEKYLTVYDPNKFNVIVNGRMASRGQITVDSRDIAIKTINSGGIVKVKMLPGKKSIGDFKTKGEFIELSSQFQSEGYYTLYITDDERNSQLVYVFITK